MSATTITVQLVRRVSAFIVALATLTWCVLGDTPGAVCGAMAAVIGPVVEMLIVGSGVFRYTAGSDGMFGVAPFLVPLYFAFGVVAALLGEIAARHWRRRASV